MEVKNGTIKIVIGRLLVENINVISEQNSEHTYL